MEQSSGTEGKEKAQLGPGWYFAVTGQLVHRSVSGLVLSKQRGIWESHLSPKGKRSCLQ